MGRRTAEKRRLVKGKKLENSVALRPRHEGLRDSQVLIGGKKSCKGLSKKGKLRIRDPENVAIFNSPLSALFGTSFAKDFFHSFLQEKRHVAEPINRPDVCHYSGPEPFPAGVG
jgi:hypothetical protein